MSDEYEQFFSVNPTNASLSLSYTNPADGPLNFDGDGLVNSNEAALWTDPYVADTDRDLFDDNVDSNALSRAWIQWGDPFYTAGDDYIYTGPAWWVDAFKIGGEWTNGTWHVEASDTNEASLNMGIVTNTLSNLVMRVDYFDHTNASLFAGYYDTNEAFVATNLFGNLIEENNTWVLIHLDFTLTNYDGIAGIRLYRGSGEITVSNSLLFVDADGDGLDADQETQLGTSDNNQDTDGDGLWDYDEVLVYGTNPAQADTDHDGISDGAEVEYGKSPTVSNNYSVIPFTELFETNTVQVGLLHGQNNWETSPTNAAIVQTQVVYQGSQALHVSSVTEASVAHLFAQPTQNVVWADLYTRVVYTVAPTGAVPDAATCFFDSSGRLVVYDGLAAGTNKWLALTNHPPVSAGNWARVTVKLDFSQQKWAVFLNTNELAQNLGFATNRTNFTSFQMDSQEAYLDNFKVSLTPPDGIDQDSDGLPDNWETQYFGNLGHSPGEDFENDGLTNLQEYQNGSDPTKADTDNDGMIDGLEVSYGNNPAVSNNYSVLPFTEIFETNTVQVGSINGQNNWTASPANLALVQTSIVYQGQQALALGAFTNQQPTTVNHLFATPAANVVWCDSFVKAIATTNPAGQPADVANLHFDDTGKLVVYDDHSSNWVTLASGISLAGNPWTRVTVKLDYSAQEWTVCLNGIVATQHIGFAVSALKFSGLTIDARYAYADKVNVSTNQPAGISMDGDNLPDDWETQYFGTLGYGNNDDPDGDSLTNVQEYQAGTNPTKADTDNDGLSDWYELNVSNTDPADADSDNDNMKDGWELQYGFNPLVSDVAADSDGDGLNSAQESALGTNPNLADSDGDGANDNVDSNPLVADQGNDPGGPTLTVLSPTEGEMILW